MKKNVLLILTFSVLFTFQTDAQHGNAQHGTLKGPAAKNHKPWKKPKSGTTILVTQPDELKGPAAKNTKVWKQELKMQPVVFEMREELTGPKAKNSSPDRDTYQVAYRRKKRYFVHDFARFNSL